MGDVLVLKIKHGATLRRITMYSSEVSFSVLVEKVRDLFKLSREGTIEFTYADNEGDVVTMADDDELKDALLIQRLNPLRLSLKLSEGSAPPMSNTTSTEEKPSQSSSKASSAAGVKREEGSSSASSRIAEEFEKIQGKVEEKIKTALKDGGVDVESVVAAFQPFLAVAPKTLSQVVEAALKSGFTASFEPSFCMHEDYSENAGVAESNAEKSAVPEVPKSEEPAGEYVPPKAEDVPKEGGENAIPASAAGSADAETDADRLFHTGVQCDLCGMCPIVGPRFKSTMKPDYDLCRTCYGLHGVEGEYNKIERPLFRPRQHPFWAEGGSFGRTGRHGFVPTSGVPPCFGGRPFHMGRGGSCGRSFENRFSEGKLDARFVKDVTIFDGTEFTPGTRFTKIWRLRNNGTMPWPQHTRLVHVGGDRFGADDFVPVPVPEEGMQPGEEIEASVDLVAPERAGRYVCHWRLMAPGGRKFGHRVWALIQVVPPNEPSPQVAESVADAPVQENSRATSLASAPPLASVPSQVEMAGTESLQPVPEAPLAAEVIVAVAPLVEVSDELPQGQNSAGIEVEDKSPPVLSVPVIFTDKAAEPATFVQAAVSAPESPKEENTSVGGFSFVEHPAAKDVAIAFPGDASVAKPLSEEVALQEIPMAVMAEASVNGLVRDVPAGNVYSEDTQMTQLLQQLEVMGFPDRELNEDLLKQQNMDFARVLDELVAATEWDPMLEELHEMGFYDTKVNRRLMFKNKGSVKRVVKELVQMYKQQDIGKAAGKRGM